MSSDFSDEQHRQTDRQTDRQRQQPTSMFIYYTQKTYTKHMIYLLTSIGFPPGGSSTVHIYTQTIHRTHSVEISTRCSFVIEFIIAKFIEGSTSFERHTAHHQEL